MKVGGWVGGLMWNGIGWGMGRQGMDEWSKRDEGAWKEKDKRKGSEREERRRKEREKEGKYRKKEKKMK